MSRIALSGALCVALQILGSPAARATPHCEQPLDPQVFPGADVDDLGGAVALGTTCPIHLLTQTTLEPGELVLSSSRGALPFKVSEAASIKSYPDGYDCACELTFATARFRHYVLQPESPLPDNEIVELLLPAMGTDRPEAKLADFATSKDHPCDPMAGAEVHVRCTTCDSCDEADPPRSAPNLDGGAVPNVGCQLGGGAPPCGSLVLLLVCGWVLLRRRVRE
jgi:hypothetical protein